MSNLFIKNLFQRETFVCIIFIKNLKLKKNKKKTPKKTILEGFLGGFFEVFLGGFFWVGFLLPTLGAGPAGD